MKILSISVALIMWGTVAYGAKVQCKDTRIAKGDSRGNYSTGVCSDDFEFETEYEEAKNEQIEKTTVKLLTKFKSFDQGCVDIGGKVKDIRKSKAKSENKQEWGPDNCIYFDGDVTCFPGTLSTWCEVSANVQIMHECVCE